MGIDFSNLKTGKGEEFIEKHSEVSKIPSKSFNNYTQFIADHYICEIYLGSANDQTGLINWRDYSIFQGVILFIVTVYLIANFVADLLYGVLDPTVRYQ